jgi:hypothetical protein
MRSRTLLFTSAVAMAALSLLVSGCGGGSATTAVNTTATEQSAALAFSHCMHLHGVPDFPDPNSSGEIPKSEVIPLVSSPQFAGAQTACGHLFGGPGKPQETVQQKRARLAAGLAFANCMRNHGFQNFPDPTTQGELTPEMVTGAGINLHERAVLQAGLACAAVTHGLITRAMVERAVTGG